MIVKVCYIFINYNIDFKLDYPGQVCYLILIINEKIYFMIRISKSKNMHVTLCNVCSVYLNQGKYSLLRIVRIFHSVKIRIRP